MKKNLGLVILLNALWACAGPPEREGPYDGLHLNQNRGVAVFTLGQDWELTTVPFIVSFARYDPETNQLIRSEPDTTARVRYALDGLGSPEGNRHVVLPAGSYVIDSIGVDGRRFLLRDFTQSWTTRRTLPQAPSIGAPHPVDG